MAKKKHIEKRDDLMICIGPAWHFRELADEVEKHLNKAAAELDKHPGRKFDAAARAVNEAFAAFTPILKGLRGEYGLPPKREGISTHVGADAIAQAAEILRGIAEKEDAPERLH